jgi:hypothetical protein
MFFAWILFLFSLDSQARIEFPSGLSSKDRQSIMQILGFGSATKVLSNPYPLGGYLGIEVGFTSDVIETSQISNLGNKAKSKDQVSFTSLSFGKGLYQNVDIFLQFTPFTESDAITAFGGHLRYGFFEASYLPIHLSLVLHGNSVNFQNQFVSDCFGSALIGGISVKDVTLYVGLGFATTYGNFIGLGGTDSQGNLINSNESVKESIFGFHRLAGLHINFSDLFMALQIDRYVEPTYSAKLGLRF